MSSIPDQNGDLSTQTLPVKRIAYMAVFIALKNGDRPRFFELCPAHRFMEFKDAQSTSMFLRIGKRREENQTKTVVCPLIEGLKKRMQVDFFIN